MASQYKPGTQRKSIGRYRISANRVAWARTAITQLALMRYTDEEMKNVEQRLPNDEGELGDTYRLMISTTSGRPYTLNLTAMTEQELDAFEGLITLALRAVRPIVRDRDREAAQRYANGDDSFTRSYRQLPQFIIREGAFGQDDRSLLVGLEDALVGPPSPRAPEREVRGGRPDVADEVSEDSESKDNSAEVDLSEGVGEVGEVGSDAGGLFRSDATTGNATPAS